MRSGFTGAKALAVLTVLAPAIIYADPILIPGAPVAGYMILGLDQTNHTFEFDVNNQTGPNSSTFPDPTFPVATTVGFNLASLTVTFADNSTLILPPSYFSLNSDGISYTGTPTSYNPSNPLKAADLVGAFALTSWTLNDSSTATVDAAFSSLVTDSSGSLQDTDFQYIQGIETPEPAAWLFIAGAGALLLIMQRRLLGEVG